jgi:hypothetical protein
MMTVISIMAFLGNDDWGQVRRSGYRRQDFRYHVSPLPAIEEAQDHA